MPDTAPDDELIEEVRKAMQSTGNRVQELEIFCKERTPLKRLFKISSLIKNSGLNFRRRPRK